MSTLRLYANDDSFLSHEALNAIPSWVNELQVALTFARDYDENGINTNGKFKPYWDQEKVTPSVIAYLKKKFSKVKVLVSIGDRDIRYPFEIKLGGDKTTWVSNATKSLTSIIKDYNLDGIDVYYENIIENGNDFVDAIGSLILNLKQDGAIRTSIAPTSPVLPSYQRLFQNQKYANSIDNIVYQFYGETNPFTTIDELNTLYSTLANQFPSQKLLSGYSTDSRDWSKISPPVYFITVGQQVSEAITVKGASIWTVSGSSSAAFSPQWIIEFINLYKGKPNSGPPHLAKK